MTLVAILTWLAFLFILIEMNWTWTYGTHHMWHSILGVIVLVCAFLAVCRKSLIHYDFIYVRINPMIIHSSLLSVFYGQYRKRNVTVAGIGYIG
jgi:hypothetical protein